MAETDYTLTTDDETAFEALARVQKIIGEDAAPSPNVTVVYQLGGGLDALSAAYAAVTNVTLKGWIDLLFTALIGTTTCYNAPFAALFVALRYIDFVGSVGGLDRGDLGHLIPPSDGYNYWTAYSKGLDASTPYQPRYLGPWKDWGTGDKKDWAPAYPQAPRAWVAAVNGVFTSWDDNPPAALIDKGNGENYDNRVPDFETNVVSGGWTDFNQIKTSTAGVWKAQLATAGSLLSPTSLTADAYLFLLHLVTTLATGDAACQALAQRIVAAPAGSIEYPNDIFINQLVYLALINLADPLGSHGLTNPRLQTAITNLEGAVQGQDPVSAAIRTSLAAHWKLLAADSAYPLQDPYSPNISFTQRRSDTLFALDKARRAISQSPSGQ